MDTAHITYLGGLRCEALHIRSGKRITTDAPVDNHGKGESFSPTDLLCVSLAVCIITTIGIAAGPKNIPFMGVTARVVKHMASDPRRVARIEVHLEIDGTALDPKQRLILERIAETCPVARSLHPDVVQELSFSYR